MINKCSELRKQIKMSTELSLCTKKNGAPVYFTANNFPPEGKNLL